MPAQVLSSLVSPVAIASFLSIRGLQKGSLSPSGASCAFLVGVFMFTGPLRAFGVTLIVFYLVGSRATKYGQRRKVKLEDGKHMAGRRDGWQVLCNSASAFIACLLWNAFFVPDSMQSKLASRLNGLRPVPIYDGSWCPIFPEVRWSRALLFVSLGHFACCMGDTLASEIGILSKTPPILITTLKTVPPGTNGGISLLGTMASIGGGLLMGVTLSIDLLVENAVCRAHWTQIAGPLGAYGCVAGLFGSLADSLVGATLQRTRFSDTSKMILQDDTKPAATEEIRVISGLNILSNNQVNLVTSILTAILLGYIGWWQ